MNGPSADMVCAGRNIAPGDERLAIFLRGARRRQREHRIDCLRVARGAQLLGNVLIAQEACDAGERSVAPPCSFFM